jgi:hypothetical protein
MHQSCHVSNLRTSNWNGPDCGTKIYSSSYFNLKSQCSLSFSLPNVFSLTECGMDCSNITRTTTI